MMKLLGIAWTVWKVASKRVGPVGGFVITGIVVAGYLFFDRWFNKE